MVTSLKVLSANLIAPEAAGQSSGLNLGSIIGGAVAGALVIAAAAVIATLCIRRRRGCNIAEQEKVPQAEPEFKAKPFYEG